MSKLTDELARVVGRRHVLTGEDAVPWGTDWTGAYVSTPLAVVRPGSTEEVAAVVQVCREARTPVVPLSGRTGLAGGGMADGAVIVSLGRLDRIRALKPEARLAIVEAGVILSALHEAAAEHDLVFPLTFGAKGSAMIGGCLATNAGGSNVVRYGNARSLCLGIEAVLPSGEILNQLGELRKDNTGFDLKDLLIGSEGTLGIITAAVVTLAPQPRAHATAMVATPDLESALALLNELQTATGGGVEAFEYMPENYIRAHLRRFPGARPPFERHHANNLLVEIAATDPAQARLREDGSLPLSDTLAEQLAAMMDRGLVVDAVIARNGAERSEMWARREAAAEIALSRAPLVNNDIALPLDRVSEFLARMRPELDRIDPGAELFVFAHLGDGNIHYTVWPTPGDPALPKAIAARCEEIAVELGGTFSAEHGVGVSKRDAMARLKDPVALKAMWRIKRALDPDNLMNPGKVLPD